MTTIRLNYYEIPEIKEYIREYIVAQWIKTKKSKLNIKTIDAGIEELLNRNNAGITLDVFEYMV